MRRRTFLTLLGGGPCLALRRSRPYGLFPTGFRLGKSTTRVSNSFCKGVLIIGSSGNFSAGSYHGRLSLIPPSRAFAIQLPISSPFLRPHLFPLSLFYSFLPKSTH